MADGGVGANALRVIRGTFCKLLIGWWMGEMDDRRFRFALALNFEFTTWKLELVTSTPSTSRQ